MPETGPFWVYVLISESTGRRSVGQTDDLARRVAEHNTPEHNPKKFTSRQAGPWRIAHSEEHPTRAAAMARERWLKSGLGRAWLDENVDRNKATFAETPLNGRASPPPAD
jgi:predicted GIY-YIG superfamily endonuclease